MQIGDLVPVAVAFVVTGIVQINKTKSFNHKLAFGANIVGTTGNTFTAGSYEKNTTTQTQSAIWNVANQLPLLGLVVAAAVIIGVLIHSFRNA